MTERAIPRKIGRYRIDGVLGEGSMAVVYAGFDPDIAREVAIKCLHQDIATDAGYQQRFLVEARAAGRLTHSNIVTIYDVGETSDGGSYIAMERLSGETLASRVDSEGFPSLSVIMDLTAQVAAALDYAHAQGVIHHDIKPENIMLVDGWTHAKVNDFGIAEQRDMVGDSTVPQIEIGGTPAYMALEHLRGEPTDGRSDLFSLGVVLYWLVTGKLPWVGIGDARRMVIERQRSPIPPIRPRDPSTPLLLIDIVETLLAPLPKDRYQHGAEVVEDLRLARRELLRLHEKPLTTRIISLRLRWTGILGTLLSFTLLLGLAAIYAKQSVAITGVALDFGSSLGRMIASESAENLLLGDHAATRALVESIARNQQINYLAIADRYGEVIASTQRAQVGGKLPSLPGQEHLSSLAGIESYRIHAVSDKDAAGMLLFDVPVHYQTATVGDLHLGISDARLRAAQKTTIWVIASVLLATLAVVIGAAYWLSRRLLTLLNLLGSAMLRVARGDFRHRIRLVRRDELGRLFALFNLMNDALQEQQRQPQHIPTRRDAIDITRPTQIMPGPDAAESDLTKASE